MDSPLLKAVPVTTGNGRCCATDDFKTPGCDPI